MPYVRNRTPPERTNGCVIKSPALFFLLLDLEDEPENALDGGVGVSELADQPPTRENENAVRALDQLLELGGDDDHRHPLPQPVA